MWRRRLGLGWSALVVVVRAAPSGSLGFSRRCCCSWRWRRRIFCTRRAMAASSASCSQMVVFIFTVYSLPSLSYIFFSVSACLCFSICLSVCLSLYISLSLSLFLPVCLPPPPPLSLQTRIHILIFKCMYI